MPELPSLHEATVDAIVGHAGGATLPFQEAHRDAGHATFFWFNELVESAPDGDVIRQFLVTAGELTRTGLAEVTIRPSLCDPAPSAGKLMLTDFAEGWTHLGDLGVAVMPAAVLHAYAERKGWRWNTDEITDGTAARDEDIARIGAEPVVAYVLGHDVNPDDGARDQAAVVGELARADDGTIRWGGLLPQGCVGAPVFMSVPLDGNSFKLVCAGVALPRDDHGFGHHPVATFDAVRRALGALGPDAPAPTTVTPPRRRRWWQRRS
ncbi:hypothetical protein [Streptomyces sp. STR69]|uniref:hypothetical protein n=1 Tax=Streptomyces sp. STR69 TaxID=1796942 RepID=UPI0021C75B8C|nr:hypothetical protein [Streptomyces sp. STR69]